MPRPCHALTMPFFSRPRHSTAVERRPVGYLPAFGFFRLPHGVPRRLLSEAYQFSSQRSIPTAVKSGSSTLQKGRSVKLLDWQFGYFRLPRGLSRSTRTVGTGQGRGHGMCELTHGMAGERHGHGMLCVNPPLFWPGRSKDKHEEIEHTCSALIATKARRLSRHTIDPITAQLTLSQHS
jgi:hypothetical protein